MSLPEHSITWPKAVYPWPPPVPHRGRRNEPAYLALVAAKLAEIYGLSVAELGRRTSRSAEELFGLPADSGAA